MCHRNRAFSTRTSTRRRLMIASASCDFQKSRWLVIASSSDVWSGTHDSLAFVRDVERATFASQMKHTKRSTQRDGIYVKQDSWWSNQDAIEASQRWSGCKQRFVIIYCGAPFSTATVQTRDWFSGRRSHTPKQWCKTSPNDRLYDIYMRIILHNFITRTNYWMPFSLCYCIAHVASYDYCTELAWIQFWIRFNF